MRKEKIEFDENLFIPAKSRFNNLLIKDLCWRRLSQLEYEKKDEKHIINIFLVNCETKEEIPEVFENQISEIREIIKNSPKKEPLFSWQEKHFRSIQKRIEEPSPYRKEVPKGILKIVSIKENFPHLKPEEVIFTRSVSKMPLGEKTV